MRRRVVITGLGAVTPLGNDVPTLWDDLLSGRSGVGPNTRFDATGLEVRIAAEVNDFDPISLFGRQQARRNDLFTSSRWKPPDKRWLLQSVCVGSTWPWFQTALLALTPSEKRRR